MTTTPSVAIVGRPNVGKSSIFNHLVGTRHAIVHPTSGVTRDRLVRRVTVGERALDLVDTGGVTIGMESTSAGVIDRGIREQVAAALTDASAAVVVVDVLAGLHPMDEEVVRMVRASGKPALVFVNKADNETREAGLDEFAKLGLPLHAVSATQGSGLEVAMAAVAALLPPTEAGTGGSPAINVAIIGRPNVGKSSFINRVLRSDRLLVSDIPGTTRDSVDVPFAIHGAEGDRSYVLIDTAGMRAKSRRGDALEGLSMLRTEKSIERADICVLVIDAGDGIVVQDKKLGAAILEQNKACAVVINKWDLCEQSARAIAPHLERDLPFMQHCPVTHVSSTTGYNIRTAVGVIDEIGRALDTSLTTGVLNRAFEDACARVAPPSVGGRRLKLFYATQTGRRPLAITLFVNHPALLTEPFRLYLIRSLRERFPLLGLPIVLQARARRAPAGTTTRKRQQIS